MLTQVDVIGEQPGLAAMNIHVGPASFSDVVQLKSIDGLGPVKASISTAQNATSDSESITDKTVGKRNIVFTFGLNPNWATQTIASLRAMLYEYFMPKSTVTLKFTTNEYPLCQISGVVEDLVPNIFSSDPEIQVSVICPDPNFVAVNSTNVTGVVVDTAILTNINYEGTVETGVVFSVKNSVARAAFTGDLTIHLEWNTIKILEVNPVTIDATKFLQISSVPGDKYVRNYAIPSNVSTNILNTIIGIPAWPTLKPGLNKFAINAPVGSGGQIWSMDYFAKFGAL